MRRVVAVLLALGPLFGGGISRQEYQSRRMELRQSLDGVLVLFGANEPDDLHLSFFQETNFLYLSGWREPGAAMMLSKNEEIIFLPERDLRMENFTGRKVGPEDAGAKEKTGFEKVMPRSALEPEFLRLARQSEHVYAIPSDAQAQKLAALAPLHEQRSALELLERRRMIKSPAEIELLTRAANASVAAHLAAWKQIRPGLFEYQIAATMVDTYEQMGCERSAYSPIVGSGPNSTILHYMANRRRMDSGEVLLMDVGAECSDYASDVTRTVPVNGKFTPRQREIYNIVLGAQKAAIAAVKPGMKIRGENSLYTIAYDYINSHGKDLHGEPLGKYFTHGLSHHVGLDVHDLSDVNAPLQPGMVITIEPGIYLPEENIGVRIEDTILVTETGSKNLSGALPRDADEIERLVTK
ncbi:MAG TPA: aminopeptidase P N-terminal domain-containing protein [Bryobacteraceae bacterium]|nr:aminopeptidase P N-terminal domain-containing protein [Bryobacteraceae bacterium]